MLLFCWLYVVAVVVVPKCWFSIFLSRCFISLCEKLTSFTHGYSHFVCICFASCWIVLFCFYLGTTILPRAVVILVVELSVCLFYSLK